MFGSGVETSSHLKCVGSSWASRTGGISVSVLSFLTHAGTRLKEWSGPTALSPEMPFQADHHISPSPSTSDFRSPTFTFGSSGSDGAMSEDEFTLEREAGDTYDAPAAAAQRKKIEKRAAGEQ
jgi:hypothetical protein